MANRSLDEKDFPIKKFKQLDTKRDFSLNNYALDIEGAAPRSNSIFTNKKDYTLDNLDIESFLRYVLMGEFTANPDTYYSIYMYKNPADTHWMVGPVWDYNLAFDNDIRLFPTHDIQDYIYNYLYTQKISMAGQIGTFVSRIMNEDPATAQRLSNVWTKARNYGLNAENLNAFVDSLAQVLYASQELNFKRWNLFRISI